jgi:hypothetical protein
MGIKGDLEKYLTTQNLFISLPINLPTDRPVYLIPLRQKLDGQ